MREADQDHADAAKPYEELLSKAKGCACKRKLVKLDDTALEKMQHGSDPMDVGAICTWIWWGGAAGDYDDEGARAVGHKGKSKGKSNGECYNCGSPGHLARELPARGPKARARARASRESATIVES